MAFDELEGRHRCGSAYKNALGRSELGGLSKLHSSISEVLELPSGVPVRYECHLKVSMKRNRDSYLNSDTGLVDDIQ